MKTEVVLVMLGQVNIVVPVPDLPTCLNLAAQGPKRVCVVTEQCEEQSTWDGRQGSTPSTSAFDADGLGTSRPIR